MENKTKTQALYPATINRIRALAAQNGNYGYRSLDTMLNEILDKFENLSDKGAS